MNAVAPSSVQPPAWLRRYSWWVVTVVLTILVGLWLLDRLSNFLVTVVISLFLAFALEPAVNGLARRGWRRGPATLAMFVALLAVLAGFGYLIGSLVTNQVMALIRTLPGAMTTITEWADDNFGIDLESGAASLQDKWDDVGGMLAGSILGIGASIVGLIFQIFTVLLFTYYMTSQGPQMRRGIASLLPAARQREVLRVWELAIDKTAGFLYSRVALGLCSGLVHGLFFWIIDLPYAATLALFVGVVSQFIPTVGTYIAGALPVLIALTVSPKTALIVFVFILAYQQIENYVLAPPLASRTMSMHPAIAFGGVLVGTSLFGAVGAFLALPVIATLQAFISTYIRRHDVVESELLNPVPTKKPKPEQTGPEQPEQPTPA